MLVANKPNITPRCSNNAKYLTLCGQQWGGLDFSNVSHKAEQYSTLSATQEDIMLHYQPHRRTVMLIGQLLYTMINIISHKPECYSALSPARRNFSQNISLYCHFYQVCRIICRTANLSMGPCWPSQRRLLHTLLFFVSHKSVYYTVMKTRKFLQQCTMEVLA